MSGAVVRLTVPSGAGGRRLDTFLASEIQDHTRSALRRLILEGRVRVDGKAAAKPGLALREGGSVEVALREPPPEGPMPEQIPIEVVHEDEQLVVVSKPAGLVVHSGHGRRSGTLVNALLGRGIPLAPGGGIERPGSSTGWTRTPRGFWSSRRPTTPCARCSARSPNAASSSATRPWCGGVRTRPQDGSSARSDGAARSDPHVGALPPRARSGDRLRHRRDDAGVRAARGADRDGADAPDPRAPAVDPPSRGGRYPLRRAELPRRAGSAQAKSAARVQEARLHSAELAFPHPATGIEARFEAPLPDEFVTLLRALRESR